MKNSISLNKQSGFFDFGAGLLLLALFGATAAVITSNDIGKTYADQELEIDFIKGSDYVSNDEQLAENDEDDVEIDFIRGSDYVSNDDVLAANEEDIEIDFIKGSDYVSNDEQLAENDEDDVEIDFISGSEYVDNEAAVQTALLQK